MWFKPLLCCTLLLVALISAIPWLGVLPVSMASPVQQSTSSQVVFKDGFESYSATTGCNSVRDGCDALPQLGSPKVFPNYWVAASSGTCKTRGGCTTWRNNKSMGLNSILAVVTEQAASGTKSAKLGASDWYGDKTSMAAHLSPTVFPSGELVSFSFSFWLSKGIDNPVCYCNPFGAGPDNALVIQAPVGKVRYYGQVFWGGKPTLGVWQIETGSGNFVYLGLDHLMTQKWHAVTVEFDWASKSWVSLVIDNQQPFAVTGLSTRDLFVASGYVDFAIFIVPYADYQSLTSASSHGYQPFYAYVDDVSVSITPTLAPSSSSNVVPELIAANSSNDRHFFSETIGKQV